MRLGSQTHSVEMEQRYLPLAFTAGNGTLTASVPANMHTAVPGVYMLFIVDSAGVPSVARMVRVAPYDIPADASPISVALVPAFRQTISSTQCAARGGATSTHGAPLALTSCNPPAYVAGTMARLGPQATGSAQLTAVRGDLSTAADEADLSLVLSATDVRDRQSDADYTPNPSGPDVTLVYKLRVTDSANGSSQSDPATATDVDFEVPANCAATGGPEGAGCSVSTSADGVMPDVIKEAKDMVLQTFRIRVDDAGQNAITGDGDDRNFAMQGIYIP
jgi:hypothetical protein